MLQLAGISIDAISTGGLATCIQLPGFDLAFDMGLCPRSAVARAAVLFTHAHVDHMGSVVHHCATRALLGMKPPLYVVPRENAADFRQLFEVWRRLDRSELEHTLVEASPGDHIPLGGGLHAVPFRSPHRVICQGYTLYRTRTRLRADLRADDPDAIRAARARGETVSEPFEAAEVAFTGDSLIEGVEQSLGARTARVLVMEVTFVDDKVSVEQCRSKGHIHLDEVIERADMFENEHLLFTHLSARYSDDQAMRVLERRLPAALRDRVTLLGHTAGAVRF
jgi:ribonuclease Z